MFGGEKHDNSNLTLYMSPILQDLSILQENRKQKEEKKNRFEPESRRMTDRLKTTRFICPGCVGSSLCLLFLLNTTLSHTTLELYYSLTLYYSTVYLCTTLLYLSRTVLQYTVSLYYSIIPIALYYSISLYYNITVSLSTIVPQRISVSQGATPCKCITVTSQKLVGTHTSLV